MFGSNEPTTLKNILLASFWPCRIWVGILLFWGWEPVDGKEQMCLVCWITGEHLIIFATDLISNHARCELTSCFYCNKYSVFSIINYLFTCLFHWRPLLPLCVNHHIFLPTCPPERKVLNSFHSRKWKGKNVFVFHIYRSSYWKENLLGYVTKHFLFAGKDSTFSLLVIESSILDLPSPAPASPGFSCAHLAETGYFSVCARWLQWER